MDQPTRRCRNLRNHRCIVGPETPDRDGEPMNLSTMLCAFSITAVFVVAGAGDVKADVARGQVLSEQACSQCHGVHLNGASANPKAPTFSVIAADPSVTEYSLHVFLRTPHWTMPDIKLSPDDIDDIVSYLVSLKPHK